jgi:soluble lytic murein transglycosylase-like protein
MMLAAAKLSEVGYRVNSRLQQISNTTGLSFASLFTSVVDTVERSDQSAKIGDLTDTVDEMLDRLSDGGISRDSTNTAKVPIVLEDKPYADIIAELSQKYGVDQTLIHAMVKSESNYNPNLKSSVGAIGLMQLMPAAAEGLGVQDAYDPRQNLDGGIRHLLGKLRQYNGDINMALAAYHYGSVPLSNRGITNLDDPKQLAGLPAGTRNYIRRVLSTMADLKESAGD